MTKDENKLEILKKVADGVLSVEEGSDLIGILDRAENKSGAPEVVYSPAEESRVVDREHPHVSSCWKAAWSSILLGGGVLTAFSAYWVYLGYQRNGMSWGFWLSWIPFLIGVGLIILGWALMDSPWLHVLVNSRNGEKSQRISIVIPLPIRLLTWIMRTFGHYMPAEIAEKGIDEVLTEVNRSLEKGEPFTIEVDDKEDGDQVRIYITK